MVTRVTSPEQRGRAHRWHQREDRIYRTGRIVMKSPGKLVALRREAIVPGTNEVGNSLAHVAASKGGSCAHQVSPGMDLGPAGRDRPEVHPLLHRIAVYMVDPGHEM